MNRPPARPVPTRQGDKLQSFVTILSNAIALLLNPVIAGNDVGPDSTTSRIIGIIRLGQSLLVQADVGSNEMDLLNQHLEAMVRENRPPTEEEWQAVQTHRQENDARLEQWTRDNPQ